MDIISSSNALIYSFFQNLEHFLKKTISQDYNFRNKKKIYAIFSQLLDLKRKRKEKVREESYWHSKKIKIKRKIKTIFHRI